MKNFKLIIFAAIAVVTIILELFVAICVIGEIYNNKEKEVLYYNIGEYVLSVDSEHAFKVSENYYLYESSDNYTENVSYLVLLSDNKTPNYMLDDYIISVFHSTVQEKPVMSGTLKCENYTESNNFQVTLLKAYYEPVEKTFNPEEYLVEAEIEAIARTLYGECGSMKSKMHQAAVVWCILNRVDSEDPNFPDDIISVIEQKYQFIGYKRTNPVREDLYELAKDVLIRWYREKNGETNVGRVLPVEYMYFHGTGRVNIFKTTYSKKNYVAWDWSLPNPYEN